MKEKSPRKENSQPTLAEIHTKLTGFGFPFVYVGGVVSSRIGPNTSLGHVNTITQSFSLQNEVPYNPVRNDGTVRDIDVVAFCEDLPMFQVAKAEMEAAFPEVPISIEGVRYPGWPERKRYKQFVVGNDIDQEGDVQFAFDDVRMSMPKEAFEVWQLQTAEGLILPVFSPATHAMRYLVRVPSGLKPKDDGEKFSSLMHLANEFTTHIGELDPVKDGEYFNAVYVPWVDFLQRCQEVSPYSFTGAKVMVDRVWWNTIGEKIANGNGPMGKIFARLGSSFSG